MDRNKFYRIREELHRHPELSGQEKHTIQYIRQVLQEFQPSRIHPLEKGHGLVAEYSFPGEGLTLLFRADIDAVAIAEKSPLPYCSENPGVAHKCGHDGHTTMLLMLAGLLHEHPLERGRILLLFQPAEENGQGAQLVLQDPWFRQQKIDRAFGPAQSSRLSVFYDCLPDRQFYLLGHQLYHYLHRKNSTCRRT